MKKHKKNFFKKIRESENVLKFSLLLDVPNIPNNITKTSSLPAIQAWIEECFSHTNKACMEFGDFKNGFFYIDPKEDDNRSHGLAKLDATNDFWLFMLKQEAILSAYDKVRKLISSIHEETTYTISQVLGNIVINNQGETKLIANHRCKGLYTLLNSYTNITDCLAFGKDSLYAHETDSSTDGARSFSGRISKKCNNYYGRLKDSYNLAYINPSNARQSSPTMLIQPNNYEFFQYITGFYSKNNKFNYIKTIISAPAKENLFSPAFHKYCCEHEGIINELHIDGLDNNPATTENTYCELTLADKLYFRYLYEKMFCVDTINCLYQCLEPLGRDNYPASMDTLSSCFLLPNVFSRKHIIQMAMDMLNYSYKKVPGKATLSDSAVAYKMKNYRPDTMTYDHKSLWIDRYINMIKSLRYIIFPVYSNHFFTLLWNSVCQEDCIDLKRLDELYFILSKYLNDPEIVSQLLDIKKSCEKDPDDNDLITFPTPIKKFFKASLLHHFNKKKPEDFDLYYQCIRSSTNAKDLTLDQISPEYLSIEYLRTFDPNIHKIIQRTIYANALNA